MKDERASAEQHCCVVLAENVELLPELQAQGTWRGPLVPYDPAHAAYGLPIPLADACIYEPINYCPWCGALMPNGEQRQ